MNAKGKITKARAGLILDQPFFGSLALRLSLKEDSDCQTAWTDGKSMGYNPDWIESLPLDQVKGIICHEVMHCAAAHQARRGERYQIKWNVAGDYAINQIIEDCKISLPVDRLLDSAYADMNADEIYNKIPEPPPESGDGNSPLEKGDKGGCNDPGKCGEVRDAVGANGNTPNPADLAQSAEEWKIATAQAAQQAKAMGNLPQSIARMVEEILEPKIDWREALRRFVDQTAKNDYSWFPPNRRHVHNGLYLPSLKSEELRPVVVAVDTSGSIGKDDVDQFAAELTAILEEHKTSATVIYCDSAIAGVEEFTSDDLPLELNPKGGGGTDFRPPFDYIAEEGMMASCLIYLTDMECRRFPEAPGYPVLWTQIGKGGKNPPFGEVLEL